MVEMCTFPHNGSDEWKIGKNNELIILGRGKGEYSGTKNTLVVYLYTHIYREKDLVKCKDHLLILLLVVQSNTDMEFLQSLHTHQFVQSGSSDSARIGPILIAIESQSGI